MREMMGKDYSILLNEEPEKPKANEIVNLDSFIPIFAHEEKAQQAAKTEDDKNLFTVIEENTINARAENLSDDDIVDDSNSFASDDSDEESKELGEEVKRNRRTISDGYKDEERGVLVQDFDDDIEMPFNTVANLEEIKTKDGDTEADEETLESKEVRHQRMLEDLEKHKKELAAKIPLDIIEKFCEMTKEDKSLVALKNNTRSRLRMKICCKSGWIKRTKWGFCLYSTNKSEQTTCCKKLKGCRKCNNCLF
eukprot:TRINITY_DN12989_c0_g3_i1.p1 TRINITY_DN12989_c0_g3~~TRINITY_DN12989_c0_g3_i1.p1  ORF type:complete len:252 (-),score=66.56 TRINITY_DN12989_c0_g3_i1:37-792(-)